MTSFSKIRAQIDTECREQLAPITCKSALFSLSAAEEKLIHSTISRRRAQRVRAINGIEAQFSHPVLIGAMENMDELALGRLTPEIRNWCGEQLRGRSGALALSADQVLVAFEDEDDALIFKLRWG